MPELAGDGWRPSYQSFRSACIACGRSPSADVTPTRPGRCTTCGGTLLTEVDLP